MKKKIGVIGHEKRIKEIREVSETFGDTIDFTFIEVESDPSSDYLKGLMEKYEPVLDGIIFSGHILYDILIEEITPVIPWEYLHRSDHQLYMTLLRISLKTNYDIHRISLDSYNKSTVKRIYESLDVDISEANIIVAKNIDDTYANMKHLKSFHLNNYLSGSISCCITGLGNVYDYLKKRGVPVFTLDPSRDVIKETLKRLQMRSEMEMNRQSQIVVMYATVDESGDYSLRNDDEYSSVINHLAVTKSIHKFVQTIGGVVTERNKGYFLIFTTRSLIESVTENYRKLPLLGLVADTALSTVSVGIGYGLSVMEAKQNATDGMSRALKNGGNQAYVVYSNKIIGPIRHSSKENDRKKVKIDDSFHRIAEETKLGVNTIFRLHSIIISTNKDTFTARELADLYGITARSMNKILEKLIANDYASIVGERMITSAGRPSRIIQLKLTV